MGKRRQFTSEFKAGAVRLVLEQGMTRTKVADDLGININQISKWIKEYQAKGSNAFPGHGQLTPQERKIRDLGEEVRQLRMERDILKKATALFANHGR